MMPADPAVDPVAALKSLGVQHPGTLTPLPGGADASMWRLTLASQPYVLRVYHADGAAVYRAELGALRIARRAGLPVPAVHLASQWQGRHVLLLDWCEGTPIGQALARRPWAIVRLGLAFGRAQASLHRATAALRLPANQGWIAWGTASDAPLAALLGRLSAPAPSLLHLDYHLFNVLTDGYQVTGLIDWANAQVGDARADVARTYSILMAEPWTPGPQPLRMTVERRVLTAAWLRGYRQVAGPVGNLAPFFAWAGAAMARDLAPRVANPDSWWEQRHLDQISAWGRWWRRVALRSGPSEG